MLPTEAPVLHQAPGGRGCLHPCHQVPLCILQALEYGHPRAEFLEGRQVTRVQVRKNIGRQVHQVLPCVTQDQRQVEVDLAQPYFYT